MADKTEQALPATVEHHSLRQALVAVQAEMPEIAKRRTANVQTKGGGYKYAYADLADVTAALLPVLARHGLAFVSRPTLTADSFRLEYSLMHESGDYQEGVWPLPDPARYTAQEIGAAITYARRYALCSVTGAAPRGDDTDAAKAQRSQAAELRRKAEAVKESPEYQAQQAEAAAHWSDVLAQAMAMTDAKAIQDLFTTEKVSKAPTEIRAQIMTRLREVRESVAEATS